MKKIILLLLVSFCLFTVLPVYTEAQTTTTTVKKKTTTSRKKKSALIGAGAGAATGAIVSNKKGKGAVIGGAIGAGAGYLYGRHKDKKSPKKVTKTKTKVVRQ